MTLFVGGVGVDDGHDGSASDTSQTCDIDIDRDINSLSANELLGFQRTTYFWGLDSSRAHLIIRGYAECKSRQDVTFDIRNPGYAQNSSVVGTVPTQYAAIWDAEAAASSWTLSVVDLVQIIARLDPGAAMGALLTTEEVRGIHSPFRPQLTPNDNTQITDGTGLGFNYNPSYPFQWYGSDAPSENMAIYHNGMVEGGSAWVQHTFPASGDVTPSFTFGYAFNQDCEGAPDLTNALQLAEICNVWPPGDLFDDFP